MRRPRTTSPTREAEDWGQTQSDLLDPEPGDPIEGSGFETEEPDWDFEERS
jgi:hypothetical protein